MNSLVAFWREFLRDPRGVGSVAPSSGALAAAIVDEILSATPGLVIEVGAGTGAITGSLIGIRDHIDDLVIVEKSPHLAGLLSQRYPLFKVQVDCASLLCKLNAPATQALTIVSSLPFRSLPQDDLMAIRDAIGMLGKRHAGFRLIQYSYFGLMPFVSHVPWLSWEKKRTVYANLPPATIWVLKNRGADGRCLTSRHL